jgi:hypothetical protein
MELTDAIWSLIRLIGSVLLAAWISSLNRPVRNSGVGGRNAMTDPRSLARTVGGWDRSTRRIPHDVPAPTFPPRSDPMWDRDLDGWPQPG